MGALYNSFFPDEDDKKKRGLSPSQVAREKIKTQKTGSLYESFFPSERTQKTVVDLPEKKPSFFERARGAVGKKISEIASKFSFKKLGQSVVAGAKTTPGMAQQALGVIASSMVESHEAAENFFTSPLASRVLKLSPATSVLPDIYKATKPITKRVAPKVEETAFKLREKGFQSQRKAIEEYSKTFEPSEGLQGYLEMAAFNVPQMLASTGLTIGTAIVTRNPTAATAVGLSTAYGLGASEVYSEARGYGLTDEQAMPMSMAGGVIIGAIDFLPLEKLIRKATVVEPIKKSIIKEIAKGIVSFGYQSGYEGITESVQEFIGNVIARSYNENKHLLEGLTEAAFVGAILGGFGDVTTSFANLFGGKGTKEATVEIDKKINEAISTKPENRTEEQKQVTQALSQIAQSFEEGSLLEAMEVPTEGRVTPEVAPKVEPTELEAPQKPKVEKKEEAEVPEEVRVTPPKKIGLELQEELRTTYKEADQEAVGQAMSEVFAELEVAEAGQRLYDEDGKVTGGISSTFPEWIPPELRSRKLFNNVMDGFADLNDIKYPPNSQPKKQELYDTLLAEIDSRAGTDSGDILERIRDAEKQEKARPQKAGRKRTPRGEGAGKQVTEAKKLESKIDTYVSKRSTKFREPGFKDFTDLSIKTLKQLEGKTTVSKQFILDLTNQGGLRQAERELVRQVVAEMPEGNINVQDFADKIKTELLPLTRGGDLPKYEDISLSGELRGNVADYIETIYQSPIKTTAGEVHFGEVNNYFAHTRVEDMTDGKTRRVIELQSDLFQKGRLEKEITSPSQELIDIELTGDIKKLRKAEDKFFPQREKEISQLQPYRNTWHERLIKEEVKQATLDGKTKLQFPTGETAMKVEGLVGRPEKWIDSDGNPLTESTIKPGVIIDIEGSTSGRQWFITEDLGEGNFKIIDDLSLSNDAVAMGFLEDSGYVNMEDGDISWSKLTKNIDDFNKVISFNEDLIERASIRETVDEKDPIYKFYEKTIQKYLKKNYDGKVIEDEQGVTWVEVDLKPEYASRPVEAFRVKEDVQRFTGRKISDEQETEIIALNKRIFGDDNVRITLQIMANSKALGASKEGMIEIVDGQADPKATFYHETVHKYIDAFTTKEEQTELFKAGVEKYDTQNLAEVEERLAEDFIGYAKSREGFVGNLRRIIDRILIRINQYLRNAGAIDTLYADILSIPKAKKKIVKVPGEQIPVGEGKEKVSRLEARIKGVLDKAPQDVIDRLGLQTFEQVNKKENIEKATRYVIDNPEDALRVLQGEIEAPRGILKNAIFIAMQDTAHTDTDLARKLASLQATRFGQELSILTEIDPDSPVQAMKSIIDVRAKVFAKHHRGKSVRKASQKVVNDIRAKIKAPTKSEWQDFIESIKC